MRCQRTILIDFDGTIVQHAFPNIGPVITGAIDAINELSRSGWSCIIGSCRNNPSLYHYPEQKEENLERVKSFLRQAGVERFKIDNGRTGKPIVQLQIDDRGISFNGCWKQLLEEHFQQKQTALNLLMKPLTVSIGVEGCIYREDNKLVNGTLEALDYLVDSGIRVVLTTFQTNRLLYDSEKERRRMLNKMKRNLSKSGISYNFLDDGNLGKPVADFYVEANMVPFKGSWTQVLQIIRGQK